MSLINYVLSWLKSRRGGAQGTTAAEHSALLRADIQEAADHVQHLMGPSRKRRPRTEWSRLGSAEPMPGFEERSKTRDRFTERGGATWSR